MATRSRQKLVDLPRDVLLRILFECDVSDLLRLERVSFEYSHTDTRSFSDAHLDLYEDSRRDTDEACLVDQAQTLGPSVRS